jgi:hypothetical protein
VPKPVAQVFRKPASATSPSALQLVSLNESKPNLFGSLVRLADIKASYHQLAAGESEPEQ